VESPEGGIMTVVSVRLPARPLTLDDVAELADRDPDHRYELQEGNLLVMPPADDEHAEMIMRIGAWLMAGGHKGRALATPGLRVGTSGRSPDVAVRRGAPRGRTVGLHPPGPPPSRAGRPAGGRAARSDRRR